MSVEVAAIAGTGMPVKAVERERPAAERFASLPHTLASGIERGHLPSLDGLRAVAAFMVVFYHYGWSWTSGGLGVLAFFVLSGFLITWLLLKEEERFGKISLKLFYIRRSLRIFPAFYFYWFGLTAALIVAHKRIVWPQSIASFFYVNNYYQAIFGDPNTGLSHTWSLGIEEQFYLLWPFTFLLLRKNRARAWFLFAAIGFVWVYREALIFVFHRNQGYLYEAFDARADHLLIGCLLAVVLREGWLSKLWHVLCAKSWLPWITAAGLAVSTAFAMRYGTGYRDAVGSIVDPLLVAILIVQTMAYRTSGLGTALNWGWMRYLGNISYSIYLYQQIVLGPVEKRVPHWLSLPAAIAAVVIAASASYWMIEKPFLRLKDRFGAGQQPAPKAAATAVAAV